MKTMKQKWLNYLKVSPLMLILVLLSCKKDKVPSPTPITEQTKWEKIAGTYKVFDTLGVYLYDMELTHKVGLNQWGIEQDSLTFQNFDGDFTFTSLQVDFSNIPMYVRIGSHDTLIDSETNRWKVNSGAVEDYNQLINDTIKLFFQKTNINYYIQDLTPYSACNCKQIAVKQH